MTDSLELTVIKVIPAAARPVFNAWLDPAALAQFTKPGDGGPNQTELTLHHVGFPSEESRGNHEGGWTRIAEVLSKVGLSSVLGFVR